MKPRLTVPRCFRTLACAAVLLGGLASAGLAQNPKVSPSGTYQATLECSDGGLRWHHAQLQVWDAADQALPTIQMSCAETYPVATGAMRMHYMLLVIDTVGVTLKQCENPSTSAIKQGRFACKAGKTSVTLAIEAM